MRNRMLRSVLVAAFSAVVALGVLGGFSDVRDEVRANTVWPSVGANSDVVTGEAGSVAQESGS
ncbi:hypothetical protein M2271_007846 [Streptomyces sp. LBL]|uniref:hypothetical protein n=1 Tax=Streptomyces sp. LBL TaxID=2940562 RepID=UPI0024736B2E|nr:hypothetical protein [Streptomyces sp. LBL]MDH6629996.1 hypothetical protein [Streptomyces sp. LBL]